ncbi:helix-turn-helix transcriptional regulator [Bacillus carboniphilus]|uniref:Helix-turn-helix transcriptional regulator n=1 Tax=Bacillus carboniphilus TaxID=86663 RepID=A0ABP3FTM2_9BACI
MEQTKMVEKAIEYMKEHIEEEITTEELANYVGYSTYHFIRIFKEITGVPPRHFLSAIRIESSKQLLLHSSSTHLKTLLSIGFRSIGSFSSRFKQFVGISPKKFRKEQDTYVTHLELYQEKKTNSGVQGYKKPPLMTCHIKTPDYFKGILFVGLFPRPIPDQRPIVGTAISHTTRYCVFTDIPPGEYFVLAAGLRWGMNPKHYFLSEQSIRGKSDQISVKMDSILDVKVELREPLPYDPPILINLPLLLFEKDRK